MSKLTVHQEKSLLNLKRTIDRLVEANQKVEDCCYQYSYYSQEHQDELWDNLEYSKQYLVHKLNDVIKEFDEK